MIVSVRALLKLTIDMQRSDMVSYSTVSCSSSLSILSSVLKVTLGLDLFKQLGIPQMALAI